MRQIMATVIGLSPQRKGGVVKATVILAPVALALLAGCGSSSTSSSSSVTTASPSSSSATSTSTGAPGGAAAAYAGTWKGTWTNTIFGTNGTVTLDVAISGTNASVTVTLTGNAFGSAAPAPFTVTGTYTTRGFTFDTTSDPFLGNCHERTDPAGGTSADCTSLPAPRIGELKLNGSWRPDGHGQFTYTVTFKDGTPPASGNVAIAKS